MAGKYLIPHNAEFELIEVEAFEITLNLIVVWIPQGNYPGLPFMRYIPVINLYILTLSVAINL